MALDSTPILLFNSLTRSKDVFKPIKSGHAGIYSCGLTVYDYGHIGNYRAFIVADILVRTLKINGYATRYIQNITDVGHLTSDADEGVDKVQKKAEKEQTQAEKIVDLYTKAFLDDSKKLNLLSPDARPKASEFIKEQISFIDELEKKNYTYKTSDGIYFDTSKTSDYGKLINLDAKGLEEGARIEKNLEKKNPTDFALWKFSPHDKKRFMEWSSPWGIGFPGWHIECSAISRTLLGFPFDIHTGGVDHKPIHHSNEIAQNEGVFDKPSVNYWLHNEFVIVDGRKMSKSLGNTYLIKDVEEKNIDPLAYRYLVLNTHYRQILNFTFESLNNAQSSYLKLKDQIKRLSSDANSATDSGFFKSYKYKKLIKDWRKKLLTSLNDDLNTPKLLAGVWEMIKDTELPPNLKLELVCEMDEVLGLDLEDNGDVESEIQELFEKRNKERVQKNWVKADELRKIIEDRGYIIEDAGDKSRIFKK